MRCLFVSEFLDLSDISRSPTRTPSSLRRAFTADLSNTGNARHVILIFLFFRNLQSQACIVHSWCVLILQSFVGEDNCSFVIRKGMYYYAQVVEEYDWSRLGRERAIACSCMSTISSFCSIILYESHYVTKMYDPWTGTAPRILFCDLQTSLDVRKRDRYQITHHGSTPPHP